MFSNVGVSTLFKGGYNSSFNTLRSLVSTNGGDGGDGRDGGDGGDDRMVCCFINLSMISSYFAWEMQTDGSFFSNLMEPKSIIAKIIMTSITMMTIIESLYIKVFIFFNLKWQSWSSWSKAEKADRLHGLLRWISFTKNLREI
jgi:hypothetical protein